MYQHITKQKNISLILGVLGEYKRIRRGDLYREVMKKQKKEYGKETSYQVISRDVDRLLKNKIIKVIEGGQRSQILSLNQ